MRVPNYLVVAALALVLAGCGGVTAPDAVPSAPATSAPAEATSTPVPATLPPTQEPSPAVEATATAMPDATPATPVPIVSTPVEEAQEGILPAPLLYIDDDGQISRLEADNSIARVVTQESERILDFDVLPDGGLVYQTYGEDASSDLIVSAADGSNRVELASGVLRGLAIHPDGSSVAVGVLGTAASGSGDELAAGVWSFPLAGGQPSLLQAASEPDDNASGTHYMPIQWSGDGTGLLLRTSPNNGPDGPAGDISSTGIALYDAASGSTRDIVAINSGPICYDATVGETPDVVYCAAAQYLGPDTPALWRVATSGEGGIQELVPAGNGDMVNIVSGPEVIDGHLYTLVGTAPSDATDLPAVAAQRTDLDGTSGMQQLSQAIIEIGYDGGLWAPDGSGVVAGRPAAGGNRTLVWYPFGGGEPAELLGGSVGTMHWARR